MKKDKLPPLVSIVGKSDSGKTTLAYIIAKEQKWLRPDHILMTIALTTILTIWGPHNVLAALIILLIGYYKFNITLQVLGLLSFGYFLISYYYQLNIGILF